ncbi:hypothetical protein BDV10DRAFT_186551 [Aspergillus recurvatus]
MAALKETFKESLCKSNPLMMMSLERSRALVPTAVEFVGAVIPMKKKQIGMGVLAIPSALDVLGMTTGIVCLVAIACLTTWSAYTIGTFKLHHREVYSIDDAGGIMFGLPGQIVLSVGFCLYFTQQPRDSPSRNQLKRCLYACHMHRRFVAVAAVAGFAFSSVRTQSRIIWLAWIGLPCILIADTLYYHQSGQMKRIY